MKALFGKSIAILFAFVFILTSITSTGMTLADTDDVTTDPPQVTEGSLSDEEKEAAEGTEEPGPEDGSVPDDGNPEVPDPTSTFFEYNDDYLYATVLFAEKDAIPADTRLVVRWFSADSYLPSDVDLYHWSDQLLNTYLDQREMAPVNTLFYELYFEQNGERVPVDRPFTVNLTYKQDVVLDQDASWENVHIFRLGQNAWTGEDEAVDTNAILDVNANGAVTTAEFYVDQSVYTPVMISMIETKEAHEQRLNGDPEEEDPEKPEETITDDDGSGDEGQKEKPEGEEGQPGNPDDPEGEEGQSENPDNPDGETPQEGTEEGTEGEDDPDTKIIYLDEPEEEPEKEPEEEKPQTRTYYASWGGDVEATIILSNPEQVPDTAEVVVTPVTPDDEEYNYDAYMEALNNHDTSITYTSHNTLLYDIKFVDTIIDENGEEQTIEYEPAEGTVQVILKFSNNQLSNEIQAQDQEKVAVNHLVTDAGVETADVSTEDIAVKPVDADVKLEGTDRVEFYTDSFSVYAFTYTITTHVITADGTDYIISVLYDIDAEIPAGARLEAREILSGQAEYQTYVTDTAETIGSTVEELTHIRLFDIRILSEEGEVIEPKAPVQVTINYADAAEIDTMEAIEIVHFGADGAEVISPETNRGGNGLVDEFVFEAESFSVYGIVSSGASTNLNGKTFAIINTASKNAVQAATQNNDARLQAEKVTVRDGSVSANKDITLWTFTSAGDGRYYIKSDDGQYINIAGTAITGRQEVANGKVTLSSDTPQALIVTSGSGTRANQVRIKNTTDAAINNYSGSTNDGFGAYNDNGNNEWFTLYDLVSLNPEFSAEKISVQDLKDAQRVILYRSVYNENTKEYEDYVIDGNGDLVKAFDKGDRVVGHSAVSPVWIVTMCLDDADEPTGYYEFYNVGTDKYLYPQADGTLVSSTTSSVTLNGRRDGEYNSTIEALDNSSMAWYGYQITKDGHGDFTLSSGTGTGSQTFSFAKYYSKTTHELHTVDTVNSAAAGITIHMFNYGNRSTIANVTGSDNYEVRVLPDPHASNTLNSEGYPTFTKGGNGKTLFEPDNSYYKGDGNYLFLKSVYDSTGYYEYSAFNNFAHYENGNFTVYQEIGTPSNENQFYYKRGNFFPFNNLDVDRAASNTNQYDGSGTQLDPFDPTKNSTLYLINNPDFYFGMTMEATFMQPKDGQDKNGPVLYSFNGDDDLWIYIDGVKVLDIGGVHDAWPGSINFATGEIIGANGGAGGARTIRDCFRNAGVFPDGTTWVEGRADQYFKGNTFIDYSSHDFKMFYMEHGAGASNLEMRFNLPVIEKGKFTVEKVLDGTSQQKYANVYFAFQAFKKENGAYVPLTSAMYEGTTDPVNFYHSVDINGKTYTNVFYLKPGEAATFPEMPPDQEYYVQELGVGTDYYDKIIVNDVKIDGEDATAVDGIYPTTVATVGNRARVTYSNHCSDKNLNELWITKKLSSGSVDDGSTFEFRVLIENANGVLAPYANGEYYIQNEDGDYFRYVNGVLTSNGKTPIVASVSGNDGKIAGIPAGYRVVIKDLLADTDFFVEEINLPAGWELDKKEAEGCATPTLVNADGQIILDTDAKITFTNKGKERLIVNKVWNSGEFVSKHGDIQIALFTRGENDSLTYVEGSLRTITAPNTSITYELKDITGYIVREVTVSGDTVTPIEANGTIEVSGENTTVGNNATDSYVVTYEEEGEEKKTDEQGATVAPYRTDTITNTMPQLTVKKTDPDGAPLKNAVFTLLQEDQKTAVTGYGSITSTDANNGNLLNEVYLPNGTYYLKETSAPAGYNALGFLLKITVSKTGITMEAEPEQATVTFTDQTLDNKLLYTFTVANTPGTPLPLTGGSGTTWLYILGGLLIAGAGAGFLIRGQRRRKKNQN